jgi:hypothetical protein
MIAEYDPQNPDGFLYGIYQGRERRTHKLARHWWHYNQLSLIRLLEGVGFCEVMRCQYQHGRCADVENIDNRPESLFMEAKKKVVCGQRRVGVP